MTNDAPAPGPADPQAGFAASTADAAVLLDVIALVAGALAVRVARQHRRAEFQDKIGVPMADTELRVRRPHGSEPNRPAPSFPPLSEISPVSHLPRQVDQHRIGLPSDDRLRAAATITVSLVTAHAEALAECASFPATGVIPPRAAGYLLATLWLADLEWGDPRVELCARFACLATLVDQIDRVPDRVAAGLDAREAHVVRVLLAEQPRLAVADVRHAAAAACR